MHLKYTWGWLYLSSMFPGAVLMLSWEPRFENYSVNDSLKLGEAE